VYYGEYLVDLAELQTQVVPTAVLKDFGGFGLMLCKKEASTEGRTARDVMYFMTARKTSS
jgi:hypothetical protein